MIKDYFSEWPEDKEFTIEDSRKFCTVGVHFIDKDVVIALNRYFYDESVIELKLIDIKKIYE